MGWGEVGAQETGTSRRLPATYLLKELAGVMGLASVTSAVTGRRHRPIDLHPLREQVLPVSTLQFTKCRDHQVEIAPLTFAAAAFP